jgi:hypothetical protein
MSETDTIQMFELVIDNIYVMLGGHVFQQTVNIAMGTYCAPLFTYLFLHSSEVDFILELLNRSGKKISRSFNFTMMFFHLIIFMTRVTRRMILVEHEMLALPENLSLSPVFRRVEMILTYLVENMFI